MYLPRPEGFKTLALHSSEHSQILFLKWKCVARSTKSAKMKNILSFKKGFLHPSIYLYMYHSRDRPDALLYGLYTGATSHTLHNKSGRTQTDILCHDCLVWKNNRQKCFFLLNKNHRNTVK